MATQICPKCKEDSFSWFVNDELSIHTVWLCNICKYQAEENESLETFCSNCNKKTKSKLKDSFEDYWWCSNCNIIEK